MNVANDLALRAKVYADLLPYIAPRLGRVTIESEPIPPPPTLVIGFLPKRPTPTD